MITLREMFDQSDYFKVLPALPSPLGTFDYIVMTPSGHRWQVRDYMVFTEYGKCFTCDGLHGARGSSVIKHKGDRNAWIKLIETYITKS